MTSIVHAGEEIDKKIATTADGVVVLDFMRGDVAVKGWEQEFIEIKGELDDSRSNLDITEKGQKTYIRLKIEGRRHKGDSADIKVHIPENKIVKFSGVKTDYKISNIKTFRLRSR